MKFVEAYNHHNGQAEWARRELFDWLTDVFEAPSLTIQQRCTDSIREHVRKQFDSEGWSDEVRIHSSYDLTVFARRDDLAFQLQTGNISRALYDLMKMQYLFTADKIEAGALAVPSNLAAKRINSNVANFNRVMNELALFDRIISVPLLLISFE